MTRQTRDLLASALFAGTIIISAIIYVVVQNTGSSLYKKPKASEVNTLSVEPIGQKKSAVSFSGKFIENTVLSFSGTTTNSIAGYFVGDHRNRVVSTTLPGSIALANTSVTLKQKAGLFIANPLAQEPFYKIDVTLEDTSQNPLIGYITLADTPWANGVTTNGLSVGIDTTQSQNSYWYWTTEMSDKLSTITPDQKAFSLKYQNRFLPRKAGDVRLTIYVTPNGTYPVINGANAGSFPDTYVGSMTFRKTKAFNYIVLGKWDTGVNTIRFRDLKFTRLDSVISSIDDVNAYFLKQTINSPAFSTLVQSNPTAFGTAGSGGAQDLLWAAFAYRGYDYYFGTDHKADVQRLVDKYLSYLTPYLTTYLSCYDTHACAIPGAPQNKLDSTLAMNHYLINNIQSNPFVVFALSSYLTGDQWRKFHDEFARVVDKSMQYITARDQTTADFPLGVNPQAQDDWNKKTKGYISDTFAEEVSWLIAFYSGYLVNYPHDTPRSEKLTDMLTFLGFHHMSLGKSLTESFPSLQLATLSPVFRTFRSQYMWPDGKLDNHDFHPSINYSFGVIGTAVEASNVLEKYGFAIPTLRNNLDLAYNGSIKQNLDISSMRWNKSMTKYQNFLLVNGSDGYWLNPNGTIANFKGQINPSRVEDWSSTYTSYSVIESVGDYQTADQFAKNIYFSYYTGAGKLFCANSCTYGSDNMFNYLFPESLYTMLFSKRSSFDATNFCEENVPYIKNYGTTDFTVTCDTTSKKVGKESLRLSSSGNANAIAYSKLIPVLPGNAYRLTYWVKTQGYQVLGSQQAGGAYARIVAAQYDASAKDVDEPLTTPRIDSGATYGQGNNILGTTDWVQKSFTFSTKPNAKYIRLYAPIAVFPNAQAKGTVWFDDINITKL
jgi:hypothetical protein